MSEAQALERFKSRFFSLSGHNLALYKDVDPRLKRYLQRAGYSDFEVLYAQLQNNPELQQDLLDSISINVSEFFRNPERFQELKQRILPPLLKDRMQLKIWSAGCSIGAEVYSLVIMMANLERLHQCRFFATDIDSYALERARKGIYSAELISHVAKSDLSYYFEPLHIKERLAYQFKAPWREKVHFDPHDLLSNSYPEGFDLIICRNVMIYFNQETKYQVYRKFWQSLKPDGVLFIGGAEQLLNIQKLNYTPISPYFLRKNKS